ncbi:MAG: 23S rRNA (adenine(2503)-C(2))-methyltransferase RlmN, partial [Pseudomonadota bacterium]|nr:23S rRNA (adenine(2503)-C(2))-methyltransferase RlmN [Pseudomonadota bacterium]
MGISNHAKTFAPPSMDVDGKRNIIGLDINELAAALAALGLEKFRTKQIWSWVYFHGVTDFAQMSTLAKPARDKLAEHFVIGRPSVSDDQQSEDGTRKWLLRMADGQEVEAVHIPESDRGALCVSSQVGCTLTCRFCHTGTQRLVRNLEASEIVMQVMLARDKLNEWPSAQEQRKLSNIVMMGMGEPLFNFENVAKALRIVMHGEGISIG